MRVKYLDVGLEGLNLHKIRNGRGRTLVRNAIGGKSGGEWEGTIIGTRPFPYPRYHPSHHGHECSPFACFG